MKINPFSLNHMELVQVDSRHNFIHQIIVILTRIALSLFFVPLSLYSFSLGFMFSAETIQPYLPAVWFETTNLYSNLLPYFPLIKKFIFAQLNHWYRDTPVWWTMVVGIPLMVMGISIFFATLFNLYYSTISPYYNRTHCPFCKQPIKARSK
jgi:hypothetical protein